jgi:hypothetical protein
VWGCWRIFPTVYDNVIDNANGKLIVIRSGFVPKGLNEGSDSTGLAEVPGTKCRDFAAKRLYKIAQGFSLGTGVGKSALKVAPDRNVFKVWRVD